MRPSKDLNSQVISQCSMLNWHSTMYKKLGKSAMDIPSGGILGLLRVLFKPIVNFFSMLLFYRAYEISTLYHMHREAFGMRPDQLVDGIEYKIIWKPYHLRKKLVTPMIWLKAKDGSHFSKIILTVTASNSKISYQDHIILFDVGETPIQTSLPSVPFRSLKFEGNKVFTPYDDLITKVLEVHDKDGNRINFLSPPKKRISPFDRLEVAMGLEKGDTEKWGEIFNLEFIEMSIKEERIRLIGPMLGSFKLIHLPRKKLFGTNWVVKTVFWAKNVVFAKQLTSEFVKYLEQHEEYKKWEQENLHRNVA